MKFLLRLLSKWRPEKPSPFAPVDSPAIKSTCFHCGEQHLVMSFIPGADTMVCDAVPENTAVVHSKKGGKSYDIYTKAQKLDPWKNTGDSEGDKKAAEEAVEEYLDITMGKADKDIKSVEFAWAHSLDASQTDTASTMVHYYNKAMNKAYTISDGTQLRQIPEVVAFLMEHFNGLDEQVRCPACASQLSDDSESLVYQDTVYEIVQHLNDGAHMWTREQIADWLETLDVDLTMKEKSNAEDA